MENLTHSLLGATLAELALPRAATPAQRRLFFAAGIVAANLPDADLLYTRITPPPLGYLLHHRGHTHTLVGLIGQAVLIGAVYMVPRLRRAIAPAAARFWALVSVALLSHILLDSWNSYGVHPFFPFDNGWYYGDAVSIFEPWLWAFLGMAVVMNTQGDRVKMVLVGLFVVLALALGWFHIIATPALAAIVITAMAMVALARRWTPRARATGALVAMTLFVVVNFGIHRVVHAKAVASLVPRAEIVDVVLSPNAGNPLCWSALAIQAIRSFDEYALKRGTIAVVRGACGSGGSTWGDPVVQSLSHLRDLAAGDCWVRGWLQFGRAPVFGEQDIADYRFGNLSTGNFTHMRLRPRDEAKICPPHLTSWALPREDLVAPGGRATLRP